VSSAPSPGRPTRPVGRLRLFHTPRFSHSSVRAPSRPSRPPKPSPVSLWGYLQTSAQLGQAPVRFRRSLQQPASPPLRPRPPRGNRRLGPHLGFHSLPYCVPKTGVYWWVPPRVPPRFSRLPDSRPSRYQGTLGAGLLWWECFVEPQSGPRTPASQNRWETPQSAGHLQGWLEGVRGKQHQCSLGAPAGFVTVSKLTSPALGRTTPPPRPLWSPAPTARHPRNFLSRLKGHHFTPSQSSLVPRPTRPPCVPRCGVSWLGTTVLSTLRPVNAAPSSTTLRPFPTNTLPLVLCPDGQLGTAPSEAARVTSLCLVWQSRSSWCLETRRNFQPSNKRLNTYP
jgi:hypothetical protein